MRIPRNAPRATYIGAFTVGGPIVRVAVLSQASDPSPFRDSHKYIVAVTSNGLSAWAYGERITVDGAKLFDTVRYSAEGAHVHYHGRKWLDKFEAEYGDAIDNIRKPTQDEVARSRLKMDALCASIGGKPIDN